MEWVTVNPDEIRGGGNILISKNTSDFQGYLSSLTNSTEKIDNLDHNTFTVQVDEFLVKTLQLVVKTNQIYTDISEVGGNLVATSKSTAGITSFDDLTGVIISMLATDYVFEYDTFTPSGNSETDYNLLKTALADFECTENDIKITTLGDL